LKTWEEKEKKKGRDVSTHGWASIRWLIINLANDASKLTSHLNAIELFVGPKEIK
jgi:type IV secretory pathway TrbF-like protein